MSTIGSGPPGSASFNSAHAVQAEIQKIAAQCSALLQQLEQQISALEALLAQEPKPPGPNATPAQLAAYQANLERWRAAVDQLQSRIHQTAEALAELDKQLQALVARLPAAYARDQALLRAAIANLHKQVSDLSAEVAATKRAVSTRGAVNGGFRGAYTRLLPTMGRVKVAARGLPLS